MQRIPLTHGGGHWFDREAATSYDEETDWDGSNQVSRVTGDQWEHERLYHTVGGQWIRNHYSQRQGSPTTYVLITLVEAARWFSLNGVEPPAVVAAEFAALEIK